MSLISVLSQSELQKGMWGAFGKPWGTLTRVHTAQVIMYIHTKLKNKEHVIEALHGAKCKFPGHQKISKWGYTKFNADEFKGIVVEKRLIVMAVGSFYLQCGPLNK